MTPVTPLRLSGALGCAFPSTSAARLSVYAALVAAPQLPGPLGILLREGLPTPGSSRSPQCGTDQCSLGIEMSRVELMAVLLVMG